MEDRERIEGLSGEFIDDGGDVRIRGIASGEGRISERQGAPRAAGYLEPELVCGPDGRLGWRVRIPGSHPLVTPAVSDGAVLVGDGFGSHGFHAFEAETGKPIWGLKTKDDGPTAAVLANGHVAFNTESCTIYVVDARTGKAVWEKWLGDPLMAQPAISGGAVFMAYPDRDRKHRLAAFELESGKPLWESELIADIISAPVVADGSVYCTTIDGSVYRIDRDSGKVIWSSPHRATSAPWIHRGRIYLSLREEAKEGDERFTAEGIDTVSMGAGARHFPRSSSRRKAAYLAMKMAGAQMQYMMDQDAKVGFAAAPAAAKLHMAEGHLGLGHVASLWSFQGSRPEVFDDGIFNVYDDVAQRLDLGTRKPIWRLRLEGEGGKDALGRVLSPPAVTAKQLYFATALGDLLAVDRESGEKLWGLNVGAPILAQPAVAEGKVFIGTADGTLYAFESGDPDPVGWRMWGGGPEHNGPAENHA